MLGVPERYKIGKNFDKKTFLSGELTKQEKRKFKEEVKEITLTHQIIGEEIPSLINSDYNYQAILFFDIKVDDLKYSSFIGEILQKIVKPPAVLRFLDNKGNYLYCFASKRLNKIDSQQVVVDDIIFTQKSSSFFPDENVKLLKQHLAFSKILNTTNKLTFYTEIITKAYLITYKHLWAGALKALETRIFYDIEKMNEIRMLLKKIINLQNQLNKAVILAEKASLNSEIKNILLRLNEIAAI
ncbi:DUF4391 domain-containing protein [Thermosediminibacter oceani]|uniref:DUF4391 domain-containing protein n=1 Tax=Thermosediminibacter oceani (strain ATCC BAA-1034 / DSM 16646 / JW/IW-1228P) TaxID=555079 RepID=D9RZB9_THEOJ|nr:DUF4391 domain-containing protein [Thermosediminibacter oceani]ADL08673.1 conserved hypothetical protein [Thermosediminibacter oceani DSM 16646]